MFETGDIWLYDLMAFYRMHNGWSEYDFTVTSGKKMQQHPSRNNFVLAQELGGDLGSMTLVTRRSAMSRRKTKSSDSDEVHT
jgi:hypothetical protein